MTNLTAFSTVVVVATLLATMLALAVLPATAPPARGDPPVTEGAGGGTGAGGGVDPPGGITDAPPPEVPNTDASWTATVGGTEFAGLTEADVGRVLWRGERVSVTYEDADGMVQTASVCEGFPAVSLSLGTSIAEEISALAGALLDFRSCVVSVSEATAELEGSVARLDGKTGVRPDRAGEAHLQRSWPISFLAVRQPYDAGPLSPALPPDCRTRPGSIARSSELQGRLKAADGAGFNLTEVTLRRCYSTDPLALEYRYHDCDPDQPAGPLIWWHEDDCGESTVPTGNRLISRAFGDFHATVVNPAFIFESTAHTIDLELSADGSREAEPGCEISPTSARVIWALVGGLPFRARFECIYHSRLHW